MGENTKMDYEQKPNFILSDYIITQKEDKNQIQPTLGKIPLKRTTELSDLQCQTSRRPVVTESVTSWYCLAINQ